MVKTAIAPAPPEQKQRTQAELNDLLKRMQHDGNIQRMRGKRSSQMLLQEAADWLVFFAGRVVVLQEIAKQQAQAPAEESRIIIPGR